MEFRIHHYNDAIVVYRLYKDNGLRMTYEEYRSLWDTLESRRMITSLWMNALKNSPFREYYLECKPVCYKDLNNTFFEFTLLKTRGLFSRASYTSFQEYGIGKHSSNEIVFFPNFTGTVLLVSPRYHKQTPFDSYAHIGNFFRNSNTVQQRNLLETVWDIYFIQLTMMSPTESLKVTTHGKSVPWLHIRIAADHSYSCPSM